MKTAARAIVAAVALLAAALVATPGHAQVGATLRVSMWTYANTTKLCPVTVADGADGVAVLDAAVGTNCIQSYRLKTYTFGRYLECIDGTCGQPEQFNILYWAMRENGVCTDYGVDGFVANPGDTLSFTYSAFAVVDCSP